MTKKTRKGKTILNPRVPTKLTNNIGKSEDCFTRLAILDNRSIPYWTPLSEDLQIRTLILTLSRTRLIQRASTKFNST
jgi:hypothetical protein